MGRKTRQSRRSAERRQQQRQTEHNQGSIPRWQLITGAAVILAVAAFLIAIVSGIGNSNASGNNITKQATTGQNTAPKIDGTIGCNAMQNVTYHVHAHVTVLDAGKPVLFDPYSGLNYNHDCRYWLHAHDTSGIVHIESPKTIHPTLKNWYDVMGERLTPTQLGTAKLKSGQHLKIWVNGKPYQGDPRSIILTQHKDIWLELGPPFKKPTKFTAWPELQGSGQ
jgi:hypothetical protein